ncbi:plastocyanin/azurin family copper-binding protein [Alphaproteobacteria bacterium]|nr:plastocyanin/azurin family copper-binding protein [Alphaproteobacteria bacterium]
MHHRLKFFIIILSLMLAKTAFAETIQIEFTEDDSYSIDVAHINIGDTIKWLPKNEGHNVEFFAGPDMNSLPLTSEIDEIHSIVFKVPGVYLYGCTPHADMGMLGLIVVGNDLHNLEAIKSIQLSRVAKSVLQRFIKKARSGAKS